MQNKISKSGKLNPLLIIIPLLILIFIAGLFLLKQPKEVNNNQELTTNIIQPQEKEPAQKVEQLDNTNENNNKLLIAECIEDWSCTDWSGCDGESQTRTCTDANNCEITKNKPTTSQSCIKEIPPETKKEDNSAKDIYLEYKAEFDKTNNFEDYIELVKKYGSSDQTSKIEQSENLSQEFKDSLFDLMKTVSPTTEEINNIEENINSDTSILTISASKEGNELEGIVKMIKENSLWKIEEESWTNS